MERLGPLDTFFIEVEDAANHMHIGSLGIMEGPAPAPGELERRIAGKLPLVPRYRQKVRLAPGNVGRPVWIDDTHFDLGYHVRHTALPPPGGDAELCTLVGRIMSQQLDRRHPLWEKWVIEGLPEGRWAVLSKVHHAMVDGIAGTDLLAVVFDLEPDPAPPPEDHWQAAPEPSSVQLAMHSLRGLLAAPVGRARTAIPMLRRPGPVARRIGEAVRGLGRMGGLLRPPSDSSLLSPIGPHRRWNRARASLADVKLIRRAFGGTVNDVVLAFVTRGWRDLLAERDELLHDRVVRTVVPVSLRTPDERGQLANRVSVMFADLPVGIDDPVDRLARLSAQLDALKHSGEVEAVDSVLAVGDLAPALPHALATRALTHLQPFVETITTNVPGPQFSLFAAGRRMLEAYPYVPIAGRMDLTVAIFSYTGQLYFGVTGEYDLAADLGILCAGIEKGAHELLAAAGISDRRA